MTIGGFTVLDAAETPARDAEVAAFAAATATEAARAASTTETSTLSNWTRARATHGSLEWIVDFDAERIRGAVTYEVKNLEAGVDEFVVDTHGGLAVHACYVDGKPAPLTVGDSHAVFGTPVAAPLTPKPLGALHQVRFEYETAPECSAAQWLAPPQTAGKVRPYLFTQCQAIHARSLVQCWNQSLGRRPAWDIFELLCLAQIELVFHDS